tara:strand:+ start:74 stop:346 length:273 start_codon:yes stop_codon:yes gene_type:complete
MVMVEITDVCIWTKHVHGNPALVNRLNEMPAGAMKVFAVDGLMGHWEKMKDGKDGRPTNGFKPIAGTKDKWLKIYAEKKGALVPFVCAED